MRRLITPRLAAVTAIAACAFPAGAGAEYLIPPENSAATQYTEALPTSRGQRDVDRPGKSARRSPERVIGKDMAKRLEAAGPDGRGAAEVAAATAPAGVGASTAAEKEGAGSRPGENGEAAAGGEPRSAGVGSVDPGNVAGTSGVGEVLGQAIGFSSGQLGVLFPLLILATLAWALAFVWRGRKRPTA